MLTHVVLIFLSVALLVAVISLMRERQFRLALQAILKRLISKWRADENTQVDDPGRHRNVDSGKRRM
jgi:hypothetical protein